MTEPTNYKIENRSHLYTVELRFWGERLEPDSISEQLKLRPSIQRNKLEILGERRITPLWGYNGHGEIGFQTEWESLNQGLNFLLQKLSPLRDLIFEISHTSNGIWWCGHFQTSFDGGPTLPAETLLEMSKFGIPFFLDNYFSDL